MCLEVVVSLLFFLNFMTTDRVMLIVFRRADTELRELLKEKLTFATYKSRG